MAVGALGKKSNFHFRFPARPVSQSGYPN